jgi:hypothetical protein
MIEGSTGCLMFAAAPVAREENDVKNLTYPNLVKTSHQLFRLFKWTSILLLFGYAPTGFVQAAGPGTDPFPVLDFNDPQKSVIINLDFYDRFNVDMSSAEVVFERTHGTAGDPPLLGVEVFDINGNLIETFNAWHPLWAFVEDDAGNESRVILPHGAAGRIICPFRPDAVEMVISDIAAEQEVISIDLLQITHPFCRDNPSESECIDIANRPPVCIATVPQQTECTGGTTSVILDGTGSFDPDKDPIVSYDWDGQFVEGTTSGATPTVTVTDLGDFKVNLNVSDDWGAMTMCSAVGAVVDTTPPEVQCNNPESIIPPDAPVSFTATSTDTCTGTLTPIIKEFDCYKLTKKGKRIDKTSSCSITIDGGVITILDSGGVGDKIEWTVEASDSSGNSTTETCALTVINPAQ